MWYIWYSKVPTAYTKRQHKVVKVIRQMAIDSETRGSHSSGIAQVGTELEYINHYCRLAVCRHKAI